MRATMADLGAPEHFGLAYDAWAPVDLSDGKIPANKRPHWLASLAGLRVSADYRHSFSRWKSSFREPGDRVFELGLASRLLVGHGNSSATDVGLTVHHTWGVPMIPGSALKGLLAHYVDAVYGPDDPGRAPWEHSDPDQQERARYQGVTWSGRRIIRGPGEVFRNLFGAPEAELDGFMRDKGFEAGASSGLVTFHDALYVPGSAPEEKPYAVDVLTVHHKGYCDSAGDNWPNDYESPNPVSFVTVRPGVRFLFALSGPPDWTGLAERLLRDALREWGVGGKTSVGYGRFLRPDQISRPEEPGGADQGLARTLKPGDRVRAVLLEERTKKGGWKARHEPSGLAGHIQNSGDVPAGARPGQVVELIVASVAAREVAFRFPTPVEERRLRKGGRKR